MFSHKRQGLNPLGLSALDGSFFLSELWFKWTSSTW